jgi:hypothetical protein
MPASGDAIEAMKKAAGCGLSGKIVCQCNDDTSSPDKLEAGAKLSSGEVSIAVPESGTFRML